VKALAAQDQIVARSGEKASADPYQIASPMILDAPVDLSRLARRGQPVALTTLGEYSCEGVHIRQLTLAPRKPTNRNDLVVTALLWTDKGHDKLVDLSITLLRGDAVIASTRLLDIDAEEKSKATKSARLLIPAGDLSDLTSLRLHIEMSVENN